ncbi:hypothetical protein DLAC_01402 [Tieghemostelium lacteum]|uniref:S-adenosyl-L-methionine-dependent methyltransferase n=1 Tax=Tieghemostelium lacteum TaxID=361077 RepID=A0A152A6M4_TIELA|nr:hypothetical protein DLAC_01402 [Tieghemostelium lacteum]|eukprot:KYR01898.1 hypothetical protein DLAC_01402 [Tieghemostelium lacteum]
MSTEKDQNEVINGVARTSLFVAACRAIITNKYLELVQKKELNISDTLLKNHIDGMISKGHYMDLGEVNESIDYFNGSGKICIYDPYAYFFINTKDSQQLLIQTVKKHQFHEEKEKEGEKEGDKKSGSFFEYINSVPLLVSWTVVLSRSTLLRMAFRTKYIDDYVMNNCHSFEQLVICGAGLDARSKRLPIPASCRVYEIDLPHVVEYKLKMLEMANQYVDQVSQCQITMIADDLTQPSWIQKLKDNGYQSDKPTFWLLEGLVMYLSKSQLDFLFSTINQLSATKSKILVHTLTPGFVDNSTTTPTSPKSPNQLDWTLLKEEFISRHEDPIQEILIPNGFSKDTSSVTYRDLIDLYQFNNTPAFVKTSQTHFSIGTK